MGEWGWKKTLLDFMNCLKLLIKSVILELGQTDQCIKNRVQKQTHNTYGHWLFNNYTSNSIGKVSEHWCFHTVHKVFIMITGPKYEGQSKSWRRKQTIFMTLGILKDILGHKLHKRKKKKRISRKLRSSHQILKWKAMLQPRTKQLQRTHTQENSLKATAKATQYKSDLNTHFTETIQMHN